VRDMKIIVTKGTGEGETKTAAFDKALWDAGIANYNLIRLSSVIPEGSDVASEKIDWNSREHGNRLYVVISEAYETEKGKKAVAGLGWLTSNNVKGKGIFVESGGRSQGEVKDYIEGTIRSMASYRPEDHGDVMTEFSERECRGKIACAVVAAVYKSEVW
jgi:arginine decarboxylase